MKKLFLHATGILSAAAIVWIFAQSAGAATLTVTPAAASNTYAGTITVQATGLTNGETVVVQKFLDANGNGVVDAGDILWQQFQLKDGKASVFFDGAKAVTNLNVPGDLDGAANGQITAAINFQLSGFEQTIVANYLFVLSSPFGNFSPVTNAFTVTNFPFGQSFNGSVVANSTNVPDATVLLFQPAGRELNPQGGTVADNSGNYTFSAPPGNYLLVAFKSNFVADPQVAGVTLGGGGNVSTNLGLISADRTISGGVIDASNSAVGLPGMLVPVSGKNSGLLTVAFTDANGNFTAPVTSDQWQVDPNDAAVAFHGYLHSQNKMQVDATTGSVSGLSIALPKANALFYGSVKDALNQAMSGISLISQEGNTFDYEQNTASDVNGNYFAGALSGSPWQLEVSNQGNPANYIFSTPAFDFNMTGGTNLNSGQALPVNFIALLATNSISGHVQNATSNPIANVQVIAAAIIGGVNFQAQTDTDGSGNYSLNVGNGNWNVTLSCQGGSDSLDNILGFGNYQCPNSQNIGITNNNGTANFTVEPCGGIQVFTASPLPNGTVGSYYSIQFNASSCNNNLNWSLNSGTPPPGLTLYSVGAFNGTPTTNGTFNFTVHVSDGNGSSTNQYYSLTINSTAAPPMISAPTHFPNGQFQMFVNASSGHNYTVQMSTNLISTNWISLLITNPASGSFLFGDPSATNSARFYRVMVGP